MREELIKDAMQCHYIFRILLELSWMNKKVVFTLQAITMLLSVSSRIAKKLVGVTWNSSNLEGVARKLRANILGGADPSSVRLRTYAVSIQLFRLIVTLWEFKKAISRFFVAALYGNTDLPLFKIVQHLFRNGGCGFRCHNSAATKFSESLLG